jgi:cardiolipin synthase
MSAPDGSSFRWLRTGDEAFPAMLKAIERAGFSIRLEMYIFADSPLGRDFRDAMVRAAKRGVQVHVMIDAAGSFSLASSFWNAFTAAGGNFRWFNPLKFGRMSYRNHRKLLVCDDEVAFIGGINIAPEYLGDGVRRGWCDLSVEIHGPLARALAEAFDGTFARASFDHKPLQRLRRATARQTTSGGNWRLLLGGPGRGDNFLKSTLASDLGAAREVQIVSAYFLPTWRIRRELGRVVRRGGRVQLVLAAKTDVRLSQLASRKLYRSLLRGGMEIYEYEPQILHAKLFIADNHVYAGSANLDSRSLNINYELLVQISEPRVSKEAAAIFTEILKHCRRIDPVSWRKSRNAWTKLLEQFAYFLLARVDPWWAQRRARNLS